MPFKAKNKNFQAWIPRDDHDWFCQWLKINSIGSDTSTRFRQFIINLRANPALLSRIQPAPQSSFQCIRGLKVVPRQRQFFCSRCKTHHPTEYQACQELNREAQE